MGGALDGMVRRYRWILDKKRRKLVDLQVLADKQREVAERNRRDRIIQDGLAVGLYRRGRAQGI